MNTSLARILTGLGIITIGVFAALGSFDVLSFSAIARDWWPTAIIFAGLIMLINDPRNYLWSLIVMIVGGKATAVVGGVSLDLRKATINKEATLHVLAFWGGVEIKVPEGWVVKTRANVIMGGIENKANAQSKKDAPVLTIVGDVIMAGVEIKH